MEGGRTGGRWQAGREQEAGQGVFTGSDGSRGLQAQRPWPSCCLRQEPREEPGPQGRGAQKRGAEVRTRAMQGPQGRAQQAERGTTLALHFRNEITWKYQRTSGAESTPHLNPRKKLSHANISKEPTTTRTSQQKQSLSNRNKTRNAQY